MTNVEEITEILNRPAGATVVYHVGHLVVDRVARRGATAADKYRATRVDETALLAMRLYEGGEVQLVQQRLGVGSFAYLAQRTLPQ